MTAPMPNRRTDRESQQFHLHNKTALDRRDTLDHYATMADAQKWRDHGEWLMAALEDLIAVHDWQHKGPRVQQAIAVLAKAKGETK